MQSPDAAAIGAALSAYRETCKYTAPVPLPAFAVSLKRAAMRPSLQGHAEALRWLAEFFDPHSPTTPDSAA